MSRKRPRKAAEKSSNIVYFKRGDTVHKIDKRQRLAFISPLMVFTILLIFVGALSSAVAAAHMTNTRREVSEAQRDLNIAQDANDMLVSQMPQPYTLMDIERIASERLGMARPDPSQIIYINVPSISHVVLNPGDYTRPEDPTFWEEMGAFITGIFNRIFGG